eukprot:CAMPEP_0175084448 /NCGR_PEP_ID=MMETSP0052_2-20121109/28066_1 /TAXON_ID=51329 ORGANISM="Polytomella parva, Strain SAG 63-3" /NCGR_SAMPLE_ID=MMETSP0052_2 /ASSEMBLY_ACC=CAM_ASM_000194 /LENGTH=1591 /DNA_ID=CAMNT_0016356255 /DNA_START=27 /DNA_END=4799 /DNA_ORIENTATION=-
MASPSEVNSQTEEGETVEDVYQMEPEIEVLLKRPDIFIGNTDKVTQTVWVHDGQRVVSKTIVFVPGFYKMFDEIVVNAADNKVRNPSMDILKIEIDENKNFISVWNNGGGIPVVWHETHKLYVPEMIFGHLRSSSNYNDNKTRLTGGRNGYGAKITNILSTEFIIETCDGSKYYRQSFKNNMKEKSEPLIRDCKPNEKWTCVSFYPDLARFGMDVLDEDTVSLMRRRVYDLAGILGKTTKVYLNGQQIPVKSFSDYVDLFLGPKDSGPPRLYERVGDRWEFCVAASEGQFQQVSFVNAICTSNGGTHVNYLVDQVTKFVAGRLNKKHKNANIKPGMVKSHMWIFINCYIENPKFDTQTKERLNLGTMKFGSTCEIPDTFLEKLYKMGVLDSVLGLAEFKNQKELKKGDGVKRSRLTGIPKLDDANDAGCTLILTEGDSAKTLAISGLGVVGRNQYGVFPLRGKLLNVRDANASMVSKNAEIQSIKQILGLQYGKVYEDTRSLRYGHLMIMTDQDHDGSHIKGLIMNYLHTFYPSLLKLPGFLLEFVTPIVKARKGKQTLVFFTMPEYDAWKEQLGEAARGWDVRYYKGLGTSTSEEAKQYFGDIPRHRKTFVWHGDPDGEAIEMAFSKKRVDDRKTWLSRFEPGTFLDHSVDRISYADFINKEMVLFSRADLERSIPSMLDGLKPGQRKILFCCFKRNLKKDIKVAQLAASVAEHSAYHHGETSLASTIVGLAQDFVGSNNINLLHPSGMFGTRLQGGKDAASARYIYTRLSSLTRFLFHEDDDVLLAYLNEEGQFIEPEWYLPILPMVLVNGADGIGTGWSTSIPNFNPRDIVDNIKRLMAGEPQQPMHPWYRGFRGRMVELPTKDVGKESRAYVCTGTAHVTEENRVEITELPVRRWTQDYKEWLESLVKPDNKNEKPLVVDYSEHHSDTNVHFDVVVVPERMPEVLEATVETKFKLANKINTSNMMLFDAKGIIKHFPTPEHIIEDFFPLRLEYYERRRQALLKAVRAKYQRILNCARFIQFVVDGKLTVNRRKKAEIEVDLERFGFDRLSKTAGGPAGKGGSGAGAGGRYSGEEEEKEEEGEADDSSALAATSKGGKGAGGSKHSTNGGLSYDYLLSMSIYSLTEEKIAALERDAEEMLKQVAALEKTSAPVMWEKDLDNFLAAYHQWEEGEEAKVADTMRSQMAARGKSKAVTKKAAASSSRATASTLVGLPGKVKSSSSSTSYASVVAGGAQPAVVKAVAVKSNGGRKGKRDGGGGGGGGRKKASKSKKSMEDDGSSGDEEFDEVDLDDDDVDDDNDNDDDSGGKKTKTKKQIEAIVLDEDAIDEANDGDNDISSKGKTKGKALSKARGGSKGGKGASEEQDTALLTAAMTSKTSSSSVSRNAKNNANKNNYDDMKHSTAINAAKTTKKTTAASSKKKSKGAYYSDSDSEEEVSDFSDEDDDEEEEEEDEEEEDEEDEGDNDEDGDEDGDDEIHSEGGEEEGDGQDEERKPENKKDRNGYNDLEDDITDDDSATHNKAKKGGRRKKEKEDSNNTDMDIENAMMLEDAMSEDAMMSEDDTVRGAAKKKGKEIKARERKSAAVEEPG